MLYAYLEIISWQKIALKSKACFECCLTNKLSLRMEFLNKLANVVVTNPLIKDFEILEVVTQAGPWVIHNAIKRSTKERVSVFVLSKKIFDKMSKSNKEFVLEKYRNGVKLLTKVRHPKFLTIQHPLEESRESLAFATEPCTNALSNLIKCSSITDVEIRYGILQLLDGIEFLHNDLKRCHRNICLDTVVINSQGLWKIFGLEFSSVSEESTEPPSPEFLFHDNEPCFSQPHIGYIAPELLSTRFGGTAADMYSMGCLIYALFNRGTTLRNAESSQGALRRSEEIAQMPLSALGSIPTEAASDIKQLVSNAPSARQQVGVFQQSNFLSDIGAVSLQFLDHLMLKNRNQKIAFFKELPGILPRLPLVVRKRRILAQLFECCKELDLTPFILPNIFHIGTDLENQDFQEYIFPGLKPLLAVTDPPQIPLIVIQNLHLMISKSKLEDSKLFVLPVLFRSLENPMVELQETVLKLLPEVVDLLDYSTLRHQLLPKIKICCLETRLLKIRVSSLICVAKVLDSSLVDRTLVSDIILPLLEQVPSREPAVLMSIVGIYQKLLKHKSCLLDKDILATRCIPILFPMLVSPSLNVQQFGTCMTIIKSMIEKVENEQLGKLKQLQQNKIEQEQSLSFSKEVVENKQVGELVTKMDQMFSNNTSQKVKNIMADPPKATASSSSFSSSMSTSKPAAPKTTNFDQLSSDVMSNSSRKSSTSSNASGFSNSMLSMNSGNTRQVPPMTNQSSKMQTSSGYQNSSQGLNTSNSSLGLMSMMSTQSNNAKPQFSAPSSNTPGNVSKANYSVGNSFSANNYGNFSSQNSGMASMNPNSYSNLPLNTGSNIGPQMSNNSSFGNLTGPNNGSAFSTNNSFGNFSMNSGPAMATFSSGNSMSSGFPNQPSMMASNNRGSNPNTGNSLDNLFGPKTTQPSLNQLSKPLPGSNNSTLNKPATNQAALDLNDIFG